jgi:hypothetical protein
MATTQTRDICGGAHALRRIVTGPVDARRHKKGVYLIERAAEAALAVLRTAAR